MANIPTTNTLRPCKEESVNFDNTQNLYIEGDNLEVLKCLRTTYLNRVKIIYIDPPYNTGNDFVYNDNFSQTADEFSVANKQIDNEGNKLVYNSSANGRYHTDWLNMMYPRLKLAKDLLTDDGVMFISIDDNEVSNLKKICDELFGANNFIACVPRQTSAQRPSQEKYVSITHDYVLIYAKHKIHYFSHVIKRDLSKAKVDHIGTFIPGDTSPILASSTQGYSPFGDYDIEVNGKIYKPITKEGERRRWLWGKTRMQKALELGIVVETNSTIRVQNYVDKEFELDTNIMVDKSPDLILTSCDLNKPLYVNSKGTTTLKNLELDKVFDFSKPISLLKILLSLNNTNEGDIILDFFSGSATTAHAVMQLNAEDGGNRKFIMVQLPENTKEKTDAFK